jgi:hypothetical protein
MVSSIIQNFVVPDARPGPFQGADIRDFGVAVLSPVQPAWWIEVVDPGKDDRGSGKEFRPVRQDHRQGRIVKRDNQVKFMAVVFTSQIIFHMVEMVIGGKTLGVQVFNGRVNKGIAPAEFLEHTGHFLIGPGVTRVVGIQDDNFGIRGCLGCG